MDTTLMLMNVLFTGLLACTIRWILWARKHRLPPGPWGIPLLGYSPFLGSRPSKDYQRLRKQYGDIFGYRIGMQYMVVLNNYTDIKEAFNKDRILDRPPDWFKMSDESNHILNKAGQEWRETRRFTTSTLRNLGLGKSKAEEIIKEEIRALLERFGSMKPDQEINVFETTHVTFLNIILTLLCGRTYQEGDELLHAMEKYNEDFLKRFLVNQQKVYYPFLRPYLWLVDVLQLNVRRTLVGMQQFLKKEIENHEEGASENQMEDFVSSYLNHIKENAGKHSSINRANILADTEMLLFAATDTTRSTIAWIFLLLAKHQDAQEKIYQEILDVFGKETPPSWNDKNKLPYTEAFITESARFKTILPAEDPHWSTEDVYIGDFFIPKNTIVLANIGEVHTDKELWGDPENFRPERFLSKDRKSASIPEYWIPFLTGKRACPGVKLANMQLFLIVTSVLQKFQVVPPKSGLSMEDTYLIIVYPTKPIISLKERE